MSSERNTTLASVYSNAFVCPHCNAFSSVKWGIALTLLGDESAEAPGLSQHFNEEEVPKVHNFATTMSTSAFVGGLRISSCSRCKLVSVWLANRLLYPDSSASEPPNEDMPDDVKAIYREAALVLPSSPRASAALLRLAIQLLLTHLGESGKNINDDIKSLVKKGLDPRLQKAFDTLRLVGNDSVHPGEIDVNDNPQISQGLFKLVNIIVEKMISEPKAIDALYDFLPDSKKDGVARRDKKT